jgi:hypothetical protein
MQNCFGQEGSARSQFNQFKKDILEELRLHHGRIGMDDDTRETYYTLLSSQPIDSLIGFVDDSVPAIRAEIFAGLICKGLDDKTIGEILKRHAEDTARFTSGSTDVIFTRSVFSYMKFIADSRDEARALNVDYNARLDWIRKRDPYKIVPGARHGFIRKDSLLRLTGLNSPVGGFRVTSFRVSIYNKIEKDIEEPMKCEGAFTEEVKGRIRKLSSGDRIFIEEIKAKGPDEKERQLGGVVLILD